MQRPFQKKMSLNQNYERCNDNQALKNFQNGPPSSTAYPKQRFSPYHSRYGPTNRLNNSNCSNSVAAAVTSAAPGFKNSISYSSLFDNISTVTTQMTINSNFSETNFFQTSMNRFNSSNSTLNSSNGVSEADENNNSDGNSNSSAVTLIIGNLDINYEESVLRMNILQYLKPITPVISLLPDGHNSFRVKVPSKQFAKLVVSHLHRKKFGHKRMIVSYARDSSSAELATLRCQVAGLLRDVPYYTLPMNTFRELFQSRFKTSININDMYRMQDICKINYTNEEKIVTLNPELIESIKHNNSIVECLELSVPYCTIHFKKEQHKGWAEQDIEPLPNVIMDLNELKQILFSILRIHKGDIPILTIMHCIESEMNIKIKANDNGINLEHLISCVNGCQIITNKFGIKVLSWSNGEIENGKENYDDPLYHISHEIVELIKISPKSTIKFNRFIPAYHNHFGKQCRVADYGYTKLIDLFEAISSTVQIMGDGDNRQLTLTHRIQLRRFSNDLTKTLRNQSNRSMLLTQLPFLYAQTQNRPFNVTEYGVTNIHDLLSGLVSHDIVVEPVYNNQDLLISKPRKKQSLMEVQKTSQFAEEVLELLRNAPQYTVLFEKFVRSYHYHFGYQCRLSDYGFVKLSELIDAVHGIIEMDTSYDENRRIVLSPNVARRVFSEQLFELALAYVTQNQLNNSTKRIKIKLLEILNLHKCKYGYQIQASTLGFNSMLDAMQGLPFIEFIEGCSDSRVDDWIICHHADTAFRENCYAACKIILSNSGKDFMLFSEFLYSYALQIPEVNVRKTIFNMNTFIEIINCQNEKQEILKLTPIMKLILEIINILKSNKITKLTELNKYLNIPLSKFFEFGYPHLKALLQGFPDIFSLIDLASSHEEYEIKLNLDCCLTALIEITKENNSYGSGSDSALDSSSFNSLSISNISNSSVGQLNKSSLFANSISNDLLFHDLKTFQSQLPIPPNVPIPPQVQPHVILPNILPNPIGRQIVRPNIPKLPDLTVPLIEPLSCPFDYFKLLTTFYESDKPDTPVVQNVPFWLDPVWSHNRPWSPDTISANAGFDALRRLKFD